MPDSENIPRPEEVESEQNNIIERFRKERVKLAVSIGQKIKAHPDISRFANSVFNMTIGSYATMTYELYKGKTIAGQEFTPLGKVVQAISISAGLSQYFFLYEKQFIAMFAAKGISWASFGWMNASNVFAPAFIGLANLLEDKYPQGAGVCREIAKRCDNPSNLFFKPNVNESPAK